MVSSKGKEETKETKRSLDVILRKWLKGKTK